MEWYLQLKTLDTNLPRERKCHCIHPWHPSFRKLLDMIQHSILCPILPGIPMVPA